MNWVLSHICVYICQTGAEEPPENCEMNEMTLPSNTGFDILPLAV